MSPLIAPPAPPVGAAQAQALFKEARRRRRRRWLASIAVVLAASVTVAVSSVVTWLHRPPGHRADRMGPAATAPAARSAAAAAVWFDGIRLHAGYIHLSGRVTQRAGAEVNADLLPLVQAGGRVYWVNPTGTFVPALGHWSQIVQYLDLATGQIGTAAPGQTVFVSADGRYLLMSQTATSLTETPVAGGAPRQLSLPRGWHLPGGDGLPDVGGGDGLATANGIIVQSADSSAWRVHALGVWNPRSGKVEVIGRGLAAIAAYTPPGARYSLLAWLPATCPFPDNCLIKITNTATLAARTVRSPLPGGFAVGGAFSPDGTRLAVFPQTTPGRTGPGSARLAIVDLATGAMRMARRPRLALGQDFAWARWLPGGTHLIVGAGTGGYVVDSAALSARVLFVARGHGQNNGNSQDINFTAAIVPLRRPTAAPVSPPQIRGAARRSH